MPVSNLASTTKTYFMEFIDDYGESMTLRHFSGIEAQKENYDDIYDMVDTTKIQDKDYQVYTDYTVKGHMQPQIMSSREQRLKHATVGYVEQEKVRIFIKAQDESGTALTSYYNSPNSFNLDLNDQIIIASDVKYIIGTILPWEISGTVVYYELHARIEIDEK